MPTIFCSGGSPRRHATASGCCRRTDVASDGYFLEAATLGAYPGIVGEGGRTALYRVTISTSLGRSLAIVANAAVVPVMAFGATIRRAGCGRIEFLFRISRAPDIALRRERTRGWQLAGGLVRRLADGVVPHLHADNSRTHNRVCVPGEFWLLAPLAVAITGKRSRERFPTSQARPGSAGVRDARDSRSAAC